jgi:uncharacterized protein (TIGR00251 family)
MTVWSPPKLLFTIYYLRFTIKPKVVRYSQDRDLTFAVRVVLRASRSEIAGEHDGALRVRIAAPPVKGPANGELVRMLARIFKTPQNAIEIVSGVNSKRKVVQVRGGEAAMLEKLILSR